MYLVIRHRSLGFSKSINLFDSGKDAKENVLSPDEFTTSIEVWKLNADQRTFDPLILDHFKESNY